MAIKVDEFIESNDINVIIEKFNNEASIRQKNERLVQSISEISYVADEFEAAAKLANDLRSANTELRNIKLLNNVEEDRCQPFNATILTDSEANLLNKDTISGDTEILATFAQTLDKSITGLNSQGTTGAIQRDVFESYECSCDTVEKVNCPSVEIDCEDCVLCLTTDEYDCSPHCTCNTVECTCDNHYKCPTYAGCKVDACSPHSDCIEDVCSGVCCDVDDFECEENCGTVSLPPYSSDCSWVSTDSAGNKTCSCNQHGCKESGCCDSEASCDGNHIDLPCECNTTANSCYGDFCNPFHVCDTYKAACTCNEDGVCTCVGEKCSTTFCEATQTVSDIDYLIQGSTTSMCNCDSVCSDFYNINTFSGDNKGYLVCNGINNTSITLHNMIANGNLSHIAKGNAVGWYNTPDPNIPNDQNPKGYEILDKGAGYRAFRAFKLSANNAENFPRQYLYKQLEAGHKYYCSVWCKSSAPVASSAGLYIGLGDVSKTNPDIKNLYSTGKITTDWNLISGIYDIEQNTGKARISVWASSSGDNAINCDIYVSRFILIDLSAHIGASQLASKTSEEWKIWCDNNIREHHTFVNFGCRWSVETSTDNVSSTWSPNWIPEGASADYEFKGFNYGDGKEFGDYVHVIRGIQGQPECYLFSKSNNNLDEKMIYYISYDAKNDSSESSDNRTHTQVYWGGDTNGSITEPSMGASLPLRKGIWKRISFLKGRPFSISRVEDNERVENSYPVRLDFDNNGYADYMHATNITCAKILDNIAEYNKAYSSSIETKDINIHWCDRWIDNRNSTLIHLNNPDIKEPSFINGIVTANDIVIKPETNEITVDTETGTVFCKKLIIL